MSASIAATNSAGAGLNSIGADVAGSFALVSGDDCSVDEPPLEHADTTMANATARTNKREPRNFDMTHPHGGKYQASADFTAAAMAAPSDDAPTRSFTALITAPIAFGPA